MHFHCAACESELPIQRAGRPPKYCGPACRQWAYRQRKRSQMPQEMLDADRWTAADDKRPVTATGHAASSTNPSTWTSHDTVSDQPHGFMLGAGFACIDLDGCIRPDGTFTDLARRILAAAPGAFVERSVSGRGLHVFGLLPEAAGMNLGGIEVYSRARFIRTTAEVVQPGGLVSLLPAVAEIKKIRQEVPCQGQWASANQTSDAATRKKGQPRRKPPEPPRSKHPQRPVNGTPRRSVGSAL